MLCERQVFGMCFSCVSMHCLGFVMTILNYHAIIYEVYGFSCATLITTQIIM